MKGWQRHLRAARDATEPGGECVERLGRRARWPGTLLRQAAAEPRPNALARLRAPPVRRFSRIGLLALAAISVAALLTWSVWPARALSERLDALELVSRSLTAEVDLDYQGSGSVEGTDRAPHIRWEVGRLDVTVTPDQGIYLVVETDEGAVHVVGTAFSVTRDALGTLVRVERGEVSVTCQGSLSRSVGPGEQTTCLPVRPAAWLGRAHALLAAGHPVDDVLHAVDQGLKLSKREGPADGELVALRIRVLVDAGRYPEALRAADAYLASGATPRRPEVQALAAELRARP